MSNENCAGCRFSSSMAPAKSLMCRRYPDATVKHMNDWCGEFKAKPAESVVTAALAKPAA